MGLMDLLRVDRSFSNQPHGAGHYKMAQGNLLPNFGGDRWPVSGPTKRVEMAGPAVKAEAKAGQAELPLATGQGTQPAGSPVPVRERAGGGDVKFTLGRFVRSMLNR